MENLKTQFGADLGPVLAVDDVSLEIEEASTAGVVGESGCGKSVTALSVMRLVPEPGRIVSGKILLRNEDLLAFSERQMQQVRGNRISMIFQDPMTALNPVFTAGAQISEAIRVHQGLGRRQARQRSIELLRSVGIAAAEQRVDAYPHQMSGGMRQRVMIAMALAGAPSLLIADEPTTALDVTVQAEILELIRRLQKERQMAVMLITHDLGVVADSCKQVYVMYAGRIVEAAPATSLFESPAHPYTAGLLQSLPTWSGSERGADASRAPRRLKAIPGTVPNLRHLPSGCRFRDRCDRAIEICARIDPALEMKRSGQWAACHNPVPYP
ncbi:MAG TPA: ABC transporter ATP-binding protein [Myxococcaceae bacterium]|nr:ABC transporter ATP-binding protein [Myxococcaceae bacterium]